MLGYSRIYHLARIHFPAGVSQIFDIGPGPFSMKSRRKIFKKYIKIYPFLT